MKPSPTAADVIATMEKLVNMNKADAVIATLAREALDDISNALDWMLLFGAPSLPSLRLLRNALLNENGEQEP